MEPKIFQGVEIDICPSCGAVLLDPGELEELAGVLGFVPPRVSSLGTRHSHRSGSFSGTRDSLESHVHHSALSAEPPEIHANVIDQAHRMLRRNPMLMVKKQWAQRCVDQ